MREEIRAKIKASPDDQIDLGEMNIQDHEIPDIIRVIVQARPKVEELFFHQNALSDEGAMALKAGLAKLKHLKAVDVQLNKIDRKGAEALFSLLSDKPKLVIPFNGNKLRDTEEIENIRAAALAQATGKAKKSFWKKHF